MPKYDYECKVCKTKFTIEKSYNDSKKIKCPHCKSINVKNKIYAAPVIFFHGDGFTKTSNN